MRRYFQSLGVCLNAFARNQKWAAIWLVRGLRVAVGCYEPKPRADVVAAGIAEAKAVIEILREK